MGMVEAHLRHLKRRNLRPSTVAQRRRAVARLGRRFDLARVTTEQIEDWFDSRCMGAAARATEISHLRGFYKWAAGEGLIAPDPTIKLTRPRLPRRLPRPIPEADLQVAVELAPLVIRSMLMLAGFAGLRACEIAGLCGEHVNRADRVLLLEETKGGGMASVPIGPHLWPVVSEFPEAGRVFLLTDGRPMAPHNVSHWCNRYLHSIGISHTLHSLRHRFGTRIYESSGRDLRATQELLRHQTPVSTAIYTYVSPGHLRSAVDGLPALGARAISAEHRRR